ncbi:MAG: Ig-like domain-containing protein [Clostridiales bacterium]|nr:Ig-like domain-containing protein [Clostridiales bacterium]
MKQFNKWKRLAAPLCLAFLLAVSAAFANLASVHFARGAAEGSYAAYNFANGTGGWTVPDGIDYYLGRSAAQIVANGTGGLYLYNDALAVNGTTSNSVVVKMRVDAASVSGLSAKFNVGAVDSAGLIDVPYASGEQAKMNTGAFAYFTFDLSGTAFNTASVTTLRFDPISGCAAGDKVTIAFIVFCAAGDVAEFANDGFDIGKSGSAHAQSDAHVIDFNEGPGNPSATSRTPYYNGWQTFRVSTGGTVATDVTWEIKETENAAPNMAGNVMSVQFVANASATDQRLTFINNGNEPVLTGDYAVVGLWSSHAFAVPANDSTSPSLNNSSAGFKVAAEGVGSATPAPNLEPRVTAFPFNKYHSTADPASPDLAAGYNLIYFPLSLFNFNGTTQGGGNASVMFTTRFDIAPLVAKRLLDAGAIQAGNIVQIDVDFIVIGGKDDGSHTNYPKGVWDKYASSAQIPVDSVTVSPSAETVSVGETKETLSATVLPVGATDKTVVWSSGDSTKVMVNPETGAITGVAETTEPVTITAESVADGTKSGSCQVTVNTVKVGSITVNGSGFMITGTYQMLTADILPATATNKTVTWSSGNKTVAVVDSASGKVDALTVGEARITATAADGSGVTGYLDVTVTDSAVSVTGVAFDFTSADMPIGGTLQLTATVDPLDATDQAVEWASNNEGVATVSETGKVTARAAGDAKITVTTRDGGKTATCDVHVSAVAVDSITVVGDEAMSIGSAQTLTANILPENATVKTIVWSSGNETVATVNPETGAVMALTAGVARITAAATDGSDASGYKDITVSAVLVGLITVNGAAAMTINGTQTLTASILPVNATDKTVTWSSGNETVATVNSETGTVTALTAGVARITATAADGSGISGYKDITVSAVAVSGITLEPTEVSLRINEKQQLTADVSPGNATDKGVIWASDDEGVARVSETGEVTAVGPGTATITAKSAADDTKVASCAVTVSSEISVIGVTVSNTAITLKAGETKQLSAAIDPGNATDKTVTWTSSDETVASVDENGLVTAKKAGIATIRATAADGGASATCDIQVTEDEAPPTAAPAKSCGSIAGGGIGGWFAATVVLVGLFLVYQAVAKRARRGNRSEN